MPPGFKRIAGAGLIALLLASLVARAYDAPTTPAPRPFCYDTDTFAFANETVFNYVNGAAQAKSSRDARQRDYTRRCFVVSRAAVQFWKFARFDSSLPAISNDELIRRIRQVTSRSVWLPALSAKERIVIPHYENLRAISAAKPGSFQENIGLGWPIYFRPGNAPIAMPLRASTEAALNDEIFHDLGMNYPTVVWLYRFPSLAINHVVVILSGVKSDRRYHYLVYDPNYTDGPKNLDFDPITSAFSYQPTFYFKGGPVNLRAIYRGVFQ